MRRSIKGLVEQLRATNAELKRVNATLEQRVAERTAQLARAKAESDQARRHLVDAIESISEGFFLFDADDRLVLCNSRFRQMYPRHAHVIEPGLSFEDLAHAAADTGVIDDTAADAERWVENRMARHCKPGEAFLQKLADGRWIQINERKTSTGGTVGVFADVTELKRREQQLVEQSERLELAMRRLQTALSVEGLGLWEAELPESRVWWSPEYAQMLGYRPDFSPSSTAWEEHLHPDNAERVIRTVEDFLVGRDDTPRLTEHLLRADGSDLWVDALMRLQRDADGVAVRLSGVDVDITEQLQRERRLREANRLVMESIRYASRIQKALLPARESLSAALPDHFLIWQPRDLVGGDFFWLYPTPRGPVVIVGDCTGHGVPGAFMTLIACGLLDRILQNTPPTRPGQVLSALHRRLQALLEQNNDGGATDDGLEAGVCFIEPGRRRLVFAGARFSLWRANGTAVDELKGDRAGAGFRRYGADTVFREQVLRIGGEDRFYLATDGLLDQIGGPRRRAFGKHRLRAFLAEHCQRPLAAQAGRLLEVFSAHQAGEIRRDDVTVLGFAAPGR